MKGFDRDNPLFSLCGLNCGLCPMFLGKYCPGCGGGEGNQSCAIARCAMAHGGVEYCFQCREYPCKTYDHIDDFDSFITHRGRKTDMEKARQSGVEAYTAEQIEKTKILDILLSDYNDGRKKTLFCAAVNLLEIQQLRQILEKIEKRWDMTTLTRKEKSDFAASLLREAAAERHIDLKLRRKK